MSPTVLVALLTALLLHVAFVHPIMTDAARFPWQTLPPGHPGSWSPVIYPPGTIHYVRQEKKITPRPVFQRAWYVGFFLMVVAVIIIYALLYIMVLLRFRTAEQASMRNCLAEENRGPIRNPLYADFSEY
ncbi:hypothetical protein TcG_05710 [Trypanosoma cruzi]|uniref:Uncharacterized protein n=2 Tax=Trypanosoma cruzi TaxID=5693 RepID=V5B1J6_TRYCR|nr:hypothetical protein TCDM_14384 [Trypanosoma cruzi Dm28c]KAF8278391.1 hypothetical protein TcBrA4_0113440 [Trypanosoma cruzi]PBJ75943.1 hypothetical protein BCY84_10652 [Trypanosoma cruzi cruzi]RNF17339.1 hypothetical protein TcG_05710 [Trypanosoma cruzi]